MWSIRRCPVHSHGCLHWREIHSIVGHDCSGPITIWQIIWQSVFFNKLEWTWFRKKRRPSVAFFGYAGSKRVHDRTCPDWLSPHSTCTTWCRETPQHCFFFLPTVSWQPTCLFIGYPNKRTARPLLPSEELENAFECIQGKSLTIIGSLQNQISSHSMCPKVYYHKEQLVMEARIGYRNGATELFPLRIN